MLLNLNSHVKENMKGCRVTAVAAATETGAGSLILEKKVVSARTAAVHMLGERQLFFSNS